MLSLSVIHCPEGRRVFPYMSVRENLEMGCYLRVDQADIERDMGEVFERFHVREQVRIVVTGTGAELLDDPHVKVAYLGIGDAHSNRAKTFR